jgi:RNA polymerase subunit RPABC4/transcription elongation factor Spt4
MLDLKQCPRCREQTDLKNEVCPYCGYRFSGPASPVSRSPSPANPQTRCPNCGASVPADRTICPVCQASLVQAGGTAGRVMVVVGFIAVVLVLAMFILNLPQLPTGTLLQVPGQTVAPAPTIPQCNIAVTGQRVSGSTIQLSVMAMTCAPRDVSKLRVIVNGYDAGTLDPRLGASGKYPGHAGTNTVVVVALFSSGYEKTLLDSIYSL